jgi:hypothetical protein
VQFTTRGHARLAAARLDVFHRHEADDGHSTVTGRSLGSACHSASF